MRTETEIAAEILALKADYHEAAQKLSAPELKKASDRIKALQGDLSDLLSAGSKPCPKCGGKPTGMRKRTDTVRVGTEVFTHGTYEVGCVPCDPETRIEGGKRITRSPRALGSTAKKAVEKWNAGEWEERTEEAAEQNAKDASAGVLTIA